MHPTLSWKSLAAAGGLAVLMAFANLASGADRIHTRRPHARVKLVHSKFTPALDLAAGDRAQRVFDLRVRRRTRAKLVVSSGTSPLVGAGGVRIRIDRCSKAWRGHGATFSCKGKTSVVLADSPVLGKHVLRRLSGRTANHLRLTLTLPQSAPNALQGQTAKLVYRFS
jgi:hypothetical protein